MTDYCPVCGAPVTGETKERWGTYTPPALTLAERAVVEAAIVIRSAPRYEMRASIHRLAVLDRKVDALLALRAAHPQEGSGEG